MGNVEVVKQIYADYAAGNMEGALGRCSDDFRFCWKADPALTRFSGQSIGAAGFVEKVGSVHKDYEYHAFRPLAIFGDGDRVAAQVEIDFSRRDTGERRIMEIAHFWTLRGGKAVELLEYYDTAAVAAIDSRAAA